MPNSCVESSHLSRPEEAVPGASSIQQQPGPRLLSRAR